MSVVSAEETLAPGTEPQVAVTVCECVRGEVCMEPLGFAIRSECAFAPSAQTSCPQRWASLRRGR